MILTPGQPLPTAPGITMDPVQRIAETRVKVSCQMAGPSVHVSVQEGRFTHPLWLHMPTIVKGIPNYNEF